MKEGRKPDYPEKPLAMSFRHCCTAPIITDRAPTHFYIMLLSICHIKQGTNTVYHHATKHLSFQTGHQHISSSYYLAPVCVTVLPCTCYVKQGIHTFCYHATKHLSFQTGHQHISSSYYLAPVISDRASTHFVTMLHRLVGLVVRRLPRERKIPGSNPACSGIFWGSSHTSDLKKMALQWLPCQEPCVIGSALRLVGPVSVYCDWVRLNV